ncbi:hypothetical protein BJV82DRAFT_670675 [Fennellomyces sp. T-0311]|nr:hypothetical protein BJV82DRAFT_670675 [Fennellomyces sp. T-0311]
MSTSVILPSNRHNAMQYQPSPLHSNKGMKPCQDAKRNGSFVTTLPYELVSEIFTMLSMKQTVQCIQICQSWRSFILSWGGLWRELSDSTCDFVRDLAPYKHHLQGRQVKTLSLHVRKRRKQNKEINFLYLHNCSQVQTADLHCGFPGRSFMRLLRLIGPSLRVLQLRVHTSPSPDITLDLILRGCTSLEHLTIYTAWSVPLYNVDTLKWNFTEHPRLASFSMYMHGRTGNMPLGHLLQSLPCLRRISINPYDFRDTNAVLQSLYQCGPALETIHFGYDSKTWTGGPISGIGLRQFLLGELTGVDESNIIPFIRKHHRTLQVIDMKFVQKLTNETTAHMAMLPFPCLQRISLGMIDVAQKQLVMHDLSSFLRGAPNLEKIHLYALPTATDTIFRLLGGLHHLHTLEVAFCDDVTPDALLQFIYHSATEQRLKRLSLQGMDAVNNIVLNAINAKLFHLETLDVSECLSINDAGLHLFSRSL